MLPWLTADFRRSAVRKYHKTAWYARPWKLTATAIRANVIAYAAECSVSITFDSIRCEPPCACIRCLLHLYVNLLFLFSQPQPGTCEEKPQWARSLWRAD